MNTTSWRLRVAALTGITCVAMLAAGCGEDALSTGTTGFGENPEELTFDLAAEDGGISAAAESPAFGDEYIASYLSDDTEVEVEDDQARDAEFRRLEEKRDADVKFVKVVWGNLRRGPEADSETERPDYAFDWTGCAVVTDGLIVPLKTIRFERGHGDHIIPYGQQDEPSRQKVCFVSHTFGGQDGILFKVVVPSANDATLRDQRPSGGDGLTPDDLFIFRTLAGGTIEIPLMELCDEDTTVWVTDEVGVSFSAFDRDDMDGVCRQGGMMGAWVAVPRDDFNGGFFRSKWVTADGGLAGYMRGRWGTLPNGEQVWVGKLIGRNGEYAGHARGRWSHGDERGTGFFAGQWVIRATDGGLLRIHGQIHGMWALNDNVENGGHLRAKWQYGDCGDDPSTDDTPVDGAAPAE